MTFRARLLTRVLREEFSKVLLQKNIRAVAQGAEPHVSPPDCLLWSPVGDMTRAEVFIDEMA